MQCLAMLCRAVATARKMSAVQSFKQRLMRLQLFIFTIESSFLLDYCQQSKKATTGLPQMTSQHRTSNSRLKKMTKNDIEGLRVIRKDDHE